MMLRDFRILGFRAFDSLSFDHFGRVNLFVGKNNVGKTTVLEAIRLYLTNDWQRLVDMLISRDEYAFRTKRKRSSSTYDTAPLAFESLFFGRPPLESRPVFIVGPISGERMTVRFTWLRRIEDEEDAATRYVPELTADASDPDVMPGLVVEGKSKFTLPIDRMERTLRRRALGQPTSQNIVYLPSSGMSQEQLGRIWDSVALTEDEDIVVGTLHSIIPTLEKLVLVQSPNIRSERIMMAKLREFTEPVPFRSLGDGVLHLLSLILGLISAKDGVLLADEVENGLHYSVQAACWEIILKQALRWNVQVFSTTHSWDCVRGLQQAAFMLDTDFAFAATLFRLERNRNGDFRSISFSSEEISIAEREDIEVR